MIGIKLTFLIIIASEMMRRKRSLHGSIIRIHKRLEHHIMIERLRYQNFINRELYLLRLEDQYLQMISMHLTISSNLPHQTYCKGLKTNVAFLIHDSIVLDVPLEEKARIKEIVQIFENTKLGKFKVNVKVGKTLGDS